MHCAGNRPVKVCTGRVVQDPGILVGICRQYSAVYMLTRTVYMYADAVIVSVVPLLKNRPEKCARPVCDLVANPEQLFRVVQ